ncbi:MAG: NRDE family protein [Flavobacteriaceae bacterium]|nr:NRDE family protein [Flavobacteriaceae bacterium]MCY4253688.1 NRDE family protein [Flavobacteriaceae bacterium]
MCIVTYVPTKTGFILTSNRDENPNRPTVAPDYYYSYNQTLIYPRDKVAGGTWFGVNCSQLKIGCVLNAQHPHDKKSSLSRGVFLRNHLTRRHFNGKLTAYHFQGLAPFEYLLVDYKSSDIQFLVYYWDGQHLITKKVDSQKEQIWSSLSLYNSEKHTNNLKIFQDGLKQNQEINQDAVFKMHETQFVQPFKSTNFHSYQQQFPIQTISITSLSVNRENKKLIYKDLITHHRTIREFH